ncbi:PAS domain-containing sensor histidine kinase [Candidatus Woesebacteria bacterium]|nr:PAS domain-containing sensor histidine kinase [Candidatus Woesebacteria bacterium]
MKKKIEKTIPTAALQSGDKKFDWLQDIKSLSIGELVQTYAYAEAIIETIRDPLIILDKDLHVMTVNKAFFDFFQVTKKETYGKYIYDLNGGEWDIPELKKLLEDILPRNSHFNDYEATHNFNKIGVKIMLLNARRVVLDENKTQLILVAIEDVTELREQEKQKDDFISLVSHELKTPLTSIKAYNYILQNKFKNHEDASVAKTFASIDTQITKVTDLISDLLSEAKTRAKGFNYRNREFDINSLVEEVVENATRRADSFTIIHQNKVKKNIIADRARIGQVLENLISNAIKYSTNTKKIIVKVSALKGTIQVMVQDFGEGISKVNLKSVFEPFFRETEMQKETFPSIGLGLYISAEIVKHYNGKIWVKSIVGKGSTFYFTLPVMKK